MPTHIHNSILELGRKLGYYSNDDIGTCNGFTLRWIEACLLGEEDAFNRRVEIILTALGDSDPLEKINSVKEKVKARETLTTEDNNWLDLLVFYESMALYQQPLKYAQIFNKVLSQHEISHASQLASSKEINELGGLTSIYSELGIYTQEEIKDLLDQLGTALEHSNYPEESSVGFILTNQNHALGLMYQGESHLWKIKDINRDSSLLTEEILTTEQLAGAIFQGFKGLYPTVEQLEASLLEEENDAISDQSESKEEQIYISLEHEGQTADIIYHVKSGMWQFEEDIEIASLSLSDPLTNRRETAQRIFNLFHQKKLQNPYVTFSTSAITTLNHEKQFHLGQQLNKLKKSQEITKEIVDREDIANLACVAASMNNISIIKTLIKSGVDLERAKNGEGATPLHIAAQYGFITIIKQLQKQTAINVNALTDDGRTPTYMAAVGNQAHVIAILAKKGANLDTPKADGSTPAFIAAQKGNVHAIKVLAKYGANLNLARKGGGTPVYVAAQNGHIAVIAELAKHGVNFNIITSEGATPTFIAAQNGHELVIAELVKHGTNLNQALANGVAPIHVAVQNGHINVIHELAKHRADLNYQTNDGETPAAYAVKNGQIKIISVLAQYGSNLNLPDHNGKTPIFLAAEKGDVAMVIELAKYGADLNQGLANGAAPIHIAVQNGHLGVIEELIKLGVNPNASMNNGATSLYIAAQQGDQKTLSLLVTHGADVTVKCNGRTPLFIAAQKGHAEATQFLLCNSELQSSPSFASAIIWRKFAKSYGEEAEKRMDDFIQSKLRDVDDEEKINILPENIAYILNHEKTVQIFKDYHIRDVFNNTKQGISQLKKSNAQRDEPEKPENSSTPSLTRGNSEDV